MMVTIEISEFKQRLDDILSELLSGGEPIELTKDGDVFAAIVPTRHSEGAIHHDRNEKYWEEWEAVSAAISEKWPVGVSAVEAIREVRRDL